MRGEDVALLVGFAATLVLFALAAARDIPTLVGRRLSPALDRTVHLALRGKEASRRTRIARLGGWAAFTQFVPIAFALSNASTAIRLAAAAEIIAALGWVVYLRRSRRVTFPNAD